MWDRVDQLLERAPHEQAREVEREGVVHDRRPPEWPALLLTVELHTPVRHAGTASSKQPLALDARGDTSIHGPEAG